ncbi:MAG: TatD family hydrolase [Bacteroidales bacterium]|nr:TatD family hydrolase [Bacteroidales bacterium]
MSYPFTDTHAHLYLEEFRDDKDSVIRRAIAQGVEKIFLPNLDSSSLAGMNNLAEQYPGTCYAMIGLHPTSVKENFREELQRIEKELDRDHYIAIGETGIDLYWDTSFLKDQQESFRRQIGWAKQHSLPIVIHARDSFDEIFAILDQEHDGQLRGVFHSFTGTREQAEKILAYGFYIGINGIVTFKNAGLDKVAAAIPTNRLLIETDAPFLAPVPHRGKRNESAFVIQVAEKMAEIHGLEVAEIAHRTTENARTLFSKAF